MIAFVGVNDGEEGDHCSRTVNWVSTLPTHHKACVTLPISVLNSLSLQNSSAIFFSKSKTFTCKSKTC